YQSSCTPPHYATICYLISRRPTRSPLFPYTTLFRSRASRGGGGAGPGDLLSAGRCRGDREELVRAGHDRRLRAQAEHHHGIEDQDRKSTRLNSSHQIISYAVFCLKKKRRPHA